MTKYLIVPHSESDFDTIAASIGLSYILEPSLILIPDKKSKSVYEFIKKYFSKFEKITTKDIKEEIFEIILVDNQYFYRTELPEEYKKLPLQIYDHHPLSKECENGKKHIKPYGSTSTIITEIIKRKKIKIPKTVATLLLCGIYEDTGYLSFPTTMEKDLEMAAYLFKIGGDIETVSKYVKNSLEPAQIKLLQELIEKTKVLEVNKFQVGIVNHRLEKFIPDFSLVLNHLIQAMGIDAVFFILGLKDHSLVIGRSKTKKFSILNIIKKLNGSGHISAASAKVQADIYTTTTKIKELITDLEESPIIAEKIMFYPLITIGEGRTISDAQMLLTRYNINTLPVINKSGKITGLITRQIVDKTKYHKLENSKVTNFMIYDFKTINKNSNIEEIKEIIIGDNQKFLPVTDKKMHPVGGITRKELMRAVFNITNNSLNKKLNYYKKKNLTSLFEEIYEKKQVLLFQSLSEIAEKNKNKIFLVGGPVRDLLLKEKSFDIDIVVEGNAVKVAKDFAKLNKFKVKIWDRFETATVYIDNNFHFDFTTARIEYYEKGGMLPIVKKSSILQDLYRRDFTINSMAISLNKNSFGCLIDPFSGYNDLKTKTIRIINTISFIEDPARIFRAVRFAGRLNFHFGKGTEQNLKSSLKKDILQNIKNYRLYHEFNKIMIEDKVYEIFILIKKYKILKYLINDFTFTEELISSIKNQQSVIEWHKLLYTGDKIKKAEIFWYTLESFLNKKQIENLHKTILFPKDKEEVIRSLQKEKKSICKKISQVKTPGEMTLLLNKIKLETVLIILSIIKNDTTRKLIVNYIIKNRYIFTEINGNDLRELGINPGPQFRKILDDVLVTKIDKGFRNKTEEILYIKKKYQYSGK